MNKDKMLDELSVLQERFANGMGWRDGEYEEALNEAIELINEMPSVDDVLESIHGEWQIEMEYGAEIYTCSKCGFESADDSNFCPNCGADMRRESKIKRCFGIPKEVAERLLEDTERKETK